MIDKIIDALLANKLADLTQYLVDRGYNENPGLARALRKLADTIDIPEDVVDVEYSETDDGEHWCSGEDCRDCFTREKVRQNQGTPSPASWTVGDVE